MVILKGCKVAGSSLVEVTVAMVILILIFGISLTVYVNITHSGVSLQKLRREFLMKDYAQQTKLKYEYFNDRINRENLVLERGVEIFQGNSELLILTIQVKGVENDSVLCRQQELIYVPHDED